MAIVIDIISAFAIDKVALLTNKLTLNTCSKFGFQTQLAYLYQYQ
jgi:hypothetical protein